MIKKIIHSLIPVLLISCNGITFNQIYPEIRSIIGSDDLLIDKEFIESRRFSFIKLKLGRDISATLTLSNISSIMYSSGFLQTEKKFIHLMEK